MSARSAACRSAPPRWTAPRVEMLNLVGDEAEEWRAILADPGGPPPPLRQRRGPPRPQDGPRHPAARRLSAGREGFIARAGERYAPAAGGRRIRHARLHHLDRQAEPLELRPDPAASPTTTQTKLFGIDVAPRRLRPASARSCRDSGRRSSPNNCRAAGRARWSAARRARPARSRTGPAAGRYCRAIDPRQLVRRARRWWRGSRAPDLAIARRSNRRCGRPGPAPG